MTDSLDTRVDATLTALASSDDVEARAVALRDEALAADRPALADRIDLAIARRAVRSKPALAVERLNDVRFRSVERDDAPLELSALRLLAIAWIKLGDRMRARALFTIAIERAHVSGDRLAEAIARVNLGYTWGEAGDAARYVEWTEPAIEMLRDLGETTRVAHALVNLASGLLRVARYADARAALDEATTLVDPADARTRAFIASVCGELQVRDGDVDRGIEQIRTARTSLCDGNEAYDASRQTQILGRSLLLAGRAAEAVREISDELRRIDERPWASIHVALYDLLAEAADAAGDAALAYRSLRRVTEIQDAISSNRDVGHAALLEENARVRYGQLIADERRASERALHRSHRDLAAALARERGMRLELARIAVIDPLTAAYNRRGLTERGSEMLDEARQRAWPLAAMMLDLDGFKTVNDTWGHETGDRVLAGVASTLRHQLREGDLVARYGGDEFVLLLPDTTGSDALRIANRIREALATLEVMCPDGSACAIRGSVGITEWDRDASLDALVRRADAALYAGRSAGRDRATLLGPATDDE